MTTAGSGSHGVAVVDPGRKYTLTVSVGPRVAGRTTTLVDARRGRRVVERFAVDDATGLLLRREQLAGNGHGRGNDRVERTVTFTKISNPVVTASAPKASTPRAEGKSPRQISRVPSGFAAPNRLGVGFQLTSRYRSADASVQLFYSDGIYAASVFEQAGALDRGDLPADATSADLGGHPVERYTTSSGTVVVWEGDDHVYTLVSDAPELDLGAMITDLPAASAGDTPEQVAKFVLAPFHW